MVNYRASSQANDLIADVAFARGEAAKLGRTVQVVATGGDWNQGWIVGADLDASGSITGSEQFRQHGVVEPEFNFKSGGSVTAISFGPAGQLATPAAGAEFAICQPTGFDKHRAVVVNGVGRAEIRVWNGSGFGGSTSVTCP
jgi:Tfp pilus assembly protein FimT